MRECHDARLTGHRRKGNTLDNVFSVAFWWPIIEQDLRTYVEACHA